ncbi:hypothetical protein Taro_003529 [Colocasia esculenta]|uniref:Uncharacterized protein n=1 Tax=Colocasia esculenta TaxID=4460 RepID=A0A843THD8_COLES|nr:hypothetical protein [Colocasia esculenta]
MEEVLHLCCPSKPRFLSRRPSPYHNAPARPRLRLPAPRALYSTSSSSAPPQSTILPLPRKPPKPLPPDEDDDDGGGGGLPCVLPEMHPPDDPRRDSSSSSSSSSSTFREKFLVLDSVGVDLLAVSAAHPRLLSTPLADLRATADFLLSAGGFTPSDLRRICGMCPEILTAGGPRALAPVFAFLLREAGVDGLHGLRRAVRRRPRLLVSDVAARLRPTLYFLQMLGVPDVGRRHAPLLSCSGVGFLPWEARAMVRRFPQLFCYSIADNLEPKFDFFAMEMGRDLRELKEFPQYFSFSLKERIMPRHWRCADGGVFLPLPALLKPGDEQFVARLEIMSFGLCETLELLWRKADLWRAEFGDWKGFLEIYTDWRIVQSSRSFSNFEDRPTSIGRIGSEAISVSTYSPPSRCLVLAAGGPTSGIRAVNFVEALIPTSGIREAYEDPMI